MNRWHTMSFRTDDITFKRVEALAEQEDRTVSKMLHILAIEALNARERYHVAGMPVQEFTAQIKEVIDEYRDPEK